MKGRKIYCLGQGKSTFDTSQAKAVSLKSLNTLQKSITVGPSDLTDAKSRDEVIDYIYRSGQDLFNFCYTRGFVEGLMRSKDVRCLTARDGSNAIVGILWGFVINHDKQPQFHFWELSRHPSMAKMGIANRLIGCAKQQQALYPQIKFATLNVDSDNRHAKSIYENEQFAALNNKEREVVKVFMTQKLTGDPQASLNPATAKLATKKFVMATIPLYKLLFFELIRRCQLTFRAHWYR